MSRKKLIRKIRICSYSECNQIYECKVSSNQKFCSRKCFYRNRKKLSREIKICKYLGCRRVFECLRNDNRKYCSKECEGKDKRGIPRTAEVKAKIKKSRRKLSREIRICADERCSNTFEVPVNSTKKYCSRSCATKNQLHSKERNKKIGDFFRRKPKSKEHREKLRGPKSEEHKKKDSEAHIKLWQDPGFREKQLKAILRKQVVKPNKLEKLLNKLLQELLPNEYQLNVNTEVMILGGKIPDFVNINGQKKIIELFGDYWHSEEVTGRTKKREEQRRIDHFSKYGYQTLIIWERELKDISKVTNRIMEFNNG